MKYYLAPMEGLTGYVYRRAYKEVFGDIDKYFSPFVANKKLSAREKRDLAPENNAGMQLVPQILTNKAEEFVYIAKNLQFQGYETVNLNLGCPSLTVVTKNRGAGFLAVPEELERFLTTIFDKSPVKISIKTRIGMNCVEECERLMEIYNKFPLEELIIHPRLGTDFYRGKPRLEQFDSCLEKSRHRICYNGDICSKKDYNDIVTAYKDLDRVMIGRGILANPGLIREIRNGEVMTKTEFWRLHDLIFEGYKEYMSGEHPTLCKMKELWIYMSVNFDEPQKLCKKVKKCESFDKYLAVIGEYREK